jgi:hypothetical protein
MSRLPPLNMVILVMLGKMSTDSSRQVVAKIAMRHVVTLMSVLPTSSVAPTGLSAWTHLPIPHRDPTVEELQLEVVQPQQLPLSPPHLLVKDVPELNTVKSEKRRNAPTQAILNSNNSIVPSLHAIKCALTKETATTS